MPNRGPALLLLILAIASGVASLVYQIVWMRRLVLVFGSATLATSTVLAVFLGGLAVGAWLWGRVADRHAGRALTIYGLVETAIGLYALASPWAFRGMERVYLALYPGLESRPGWYAGVQFMLSALVILPPAALMGGTLPLLARRVTVGVDHVQGVAALYGWNTMGAAAGAALATYALLPWLGLTAAITTAATLNGLCAVAALALGAAGRTSERRAPEDLPFPPEVGVPRGQSVLLLVGFGLSGVAAMAYELVWARLLGLVMGSSVYAFGTLVVVLLAGLGLGSAIYARLRLEPAGHRLAFGVLQSMTGLGGVASLLIAPHLPFVLMSVFPLVRGAFGWQIAAQFLVAALVAFLPSLLMGAAFPAAVGSLGRSATSVGRSIGTAYVANTVGTVVGAFVAGFILIPGLGLRSTLVLGVAANLIGGMGVLVTAWSRRRWPLLAPALVALGVILVLPSWPREVFAIGAGFFAPMFANREGLARGVASLRLLYYRDGLNTTISVDEADGYLVYRSNGKTDASTYPRDMANQVLLGHVPMFLHPDPREVFVLGLGTGVTAAAIARHPVARIDIAELEPAAIAAARLFERANRRVLDDPRVRVLVGDGRNRLLGSPNRYDVMVSDASDIWIAGVGALFTREFYQTVADRLKPGGLMVQWLHTNCLAPPEFRLLVATFRAVFPRVAIWSSGVGDVFLVGSREPVPWVYDRLVNRIEATAGVRHDLQSIGIWHPAAMFAAFVIDDASVAHLVGPRPRVHTDDVPTLEFVTPRSLYVDTNAELEEIFRRIRGAPFPRIEGFDAERDLDAVATYLLGFAYASQGRSPQGVTYMERSVQMAPGRAPLWVGLGHRYRELGRRSDAETAFVRAVAVDPADVQARLALAAFLLDEGQAARALDIAQAALRHEPDNAGVKDLVARARAAARR
ncbi:MAG TPA: fused MFS/spermidine synthase [Candidatus Acidoferrum sp.]|nr:fused MFS/spermidine synthase [Candidatus Acidoferrum sp.]